MSARLAAMRTTLARRLLYASQLGFLDALRILLAPRGAQVVLHPRGAANPVLVRKTIGDLATYRQVFVDMEYDTPDLATPAPRLLVDAGAHVGLATVFFASRLPDTTIVAVEPDPENYGILVRNSRPYPNVHAVNAAIWDCPGRVSAVDPGAESWAFRFHESASGGVDAIHMSELTRRFGPIDVLKMDIEGSERRVFESDDVSWAGPLRLLLIELHDRIVPGCAAALYRRIVSRPFTKSQRGEVEIYNFSGLAEH